MPSPRYFATLLSAATLTACGGQDDATGKKVADEDPLVVTFSPCATETGPTDECATAQVPLDWNVDDGREIPSFVRRIPATDPKRGQLWMLAGGPTSGESLDWNARQMAEVFPDLDIYLPDHRGNGGSADWGCESNAATLEQAGDTEWYLGEVEDCFSYIIAEYGDTALFGTTAAARDLLALMEATESDGDRYVYSLSYGTYWAQRALQIAPDMADGVVLDSVCPPGLCGGLEIDAGRHSVGRLALERGTADPMTRDLGPDPYAFLENMFERLAAGHCSDVVGDRGLDPLRFALGGGQLSWFTTGQMQEAAFRLDRCSAADMDALHFYAELWDETTFGVNAAQLYMLGKTEMWTLPIPTPEALDAEWADSVFRSGEPALRVRYTESLGDARDAYSGAYPTSDTPILILSGEIDPTTPPEFAQEAMGNLENARNYTFSNGRHGAVHSSFVDNDTRACGLQLMADFLADPKGQLDDGCLNHLVPNSWGLTADQMEWLFGTSIP